MRRRQARPRGAARCPCRPGRRRSRRCRCRRARRRACATCARARLSPNRSRPSLRTASTAASELTLTIVPPPLRRMTGSACWMRCSGAKTFVVKMRSIVAGESWSSAGSGERPMVEALLTTRSMRPKRRSAASTSAWTCAPSATSPAIATTGTSCDSSRSACVERVRAARVDDQRDPRARELARDRAAQAFRRAGDDGDVTALEPGVIVHAPAYARGADAATLRRPGLHLAVRPGARTEGFLSERRGAEEATQIARNPC